MDATAVSLCMDNDLPIVVFDLMGQGNVVRAVRGESDRHAGKQERATAGTGTASSGPDERRTLRSRND